MQLLSKHVLQIFKRVSAEQCIEVIEQLFPLIQRLSFEETWGALTLALP